MLFETQESNRHALGTLFAGSEGHAWTQVRLDRFSPFFMVVIEASQQYLAETWQLATLEDLIFCKETLALNFPMRAVSIFLISPAHVNKSRQWLIEPLKEAWEIEYSKYADPAFRYVLHDGRDYIYGICDGEEIPKDAAWKQRI